MNTEEFIVAKWKLNFRSNLHSFRHGINVPDKDESQNALGQVEHITSSEPANGEGVPGSEELKRQLREAKQAEAERKLDEAERDQQ